MSLPCPSLGPSGLCLLIPLHCSQTAVEPSSVRMDCRFSNLQLLLIGLLQIWQCARGQSSYIIDAVGLTILPSSTVESGTPVTLRCLVRVSHDNIPNLTHTFVFRRDGVLIFSTTTTEDSVIYELNPARAADTGNYECRVTVKDKSRTSFGVKLEVKGLQTPSLYLNKTSPYESEEFTAICSAPEEKGSLIFRFYQRFRSGESQKIKQSAPSRNSSETTLALRMVGDSFLYCDYEINLGSGPRRSNRSSEIQVVVKGLYISPVMNVLPSSEVFEGDVVEVVCKVVSSLRNIEVFLTKDRRILKQAPFSLSHLFTVQEGDSGELACKAEWNNVQKETYQPITVKELFSKPQLTVEPLEIFEGERFKLKCSVSVYVPERINNNTMRFSIYKNNVKVTSSESHIMLASSSNNGNYTCKAQAASLRHSFIKESRAVVIEAKIPVSKPVLTVVGHTLVLGKRFQLLCHSDSGTLPIVYTLHGPNQLLETKLVSDPRERAIFNSSKVYKKSEVSMFLCRARNSPHRPVVSEPGQLLRSTIIIEPVSSPILKVLPNMGDVSEGQDMILECSVQSGTLPITFTWYHSESPGFLKSQIFQNRSATHRIKDVRGEHRGRYYCESNNPANEIKRSLTITIGVKLAGWKKGLIAVFCVLLVLALILAFAFKRRLLLFKRKTTRELSVKSAGTKAERLSLTQAEVNEAANVTPGMMGKSVWSEHVSGSESDDQNSVTAPEKTEPQYTGVEIPQADPNNAPVKQGTDTVCGEVTDSAQGVPEQADGQGSVEYAQLNHDVDQPRDQDTHCDHSVHDGPTDDGDNTTADSGE